MESSHLGLTLDDFQKEQECIDKLIDKLLNADTASSSGEFLSDINNSSVSRTPSQATVTRRGRGRPPKSNPVHSSPVSRSVNGRQTLDSVIKCLNKLNLQNKNLLQHVRSLSHRALKNESAQAVTSDSLSKTNVNEISEDLSDRLEKIESGLNANVLLCKGPAIPELIEQVKVGSSVNYEGLKGSLCRAICGDEVTEIDIKNSQVAIIGRDKKIVKIDCANSFSRLHIVSRHAKNAQMVFMSVNS